MARTLSYQVGILTLGRFAAYLAMFFVPLVNVRALSVHDYGVYRQYWLLFETISPLLIMSFDRSLLYYFPRASGRREKSVYLTQTIVFLVAGGIVSWAVYGVLYAVLGEGLGGVVKQYFWHLCLFTLFMMTAHYMESLFVAEKQVERQSVYQVVSSTLQAVTVILISYFTRNVSLLVWGLTAFAALKFVFALSYASAVYRPSLRRVSIRSIREQLSYALPLGMAAIVLLLLTQTDKFLITKFLGREAFAIYSIGAFQIPFVGIIRSSITSVTFPLMSQMQSEGRYGEILGLWQRATLKTATVFFPIFIFFEVAARPFVTILFREAYAGAVPVFMIYLFLFLRSTVETGGVIMVFKKTPFLLKVNAAAFATNVVLSILLYRQFGRLGVPIATVIVVYLQNGLNMAKAGRLLGVPFFKLMPWMELAKRLAVAFGHGVAVYLLYRYVEVDNVVELGLTAAAYFIVYFAVSLRLRFITTGEIRAIFGGLSR
ncbi:MAG: oligosaccharide flippase family protein [Candidatus Krumholzibacteriia bacterium]